MIRILASLMFLGTNLIVANNSFEIEAGYSRIFDFENNRGSDGDRLFYVDSNNLDGFEASVKHRTFENVNNGIDISFKAKFSQNEGDAKIGGATESLYENYGKNVLLRDYDFSTILSKVEGDMEGMLHLDIGRGIYVQDKGSLSTEIKYYKYGFGGGVNYEIFKNLRVGIDATYSTTYEAKLKNADKDSGGSGIRIPSSKILNVSLPLNYDISDSFSIYLTPSYENRDIKETESFPCNSEGDDSKENDTTCVFFFNDMEIKKVTTGLKYRF